MKAKILNALKTKYANLGLGDKAFDGVASFLEKTITKEEEIEGVITREDTATLLKSIQGETDSLRTKHAQAVKDFEDYKASIDAEKLNTKKVAAYKALLKKAGIKEKIIDLIVKGTSMDDIELDDKDEIKEADTRMDNVKKEYADYIVKTKDEGEDPETPPGGNGGSGGAGQLSRAAQLAQKHNERLYGVKGDNK